MKLKPFKINLFETRLMGFQHFSGSLFYQCYPSIRLTFQASLLCSQYSYNNASVTKILCYDAGCRHLHCFLTQIDPFMAFYKNQTNNFGTGLDSPFPYTKTLETFHKHLNKYFTVLMWQIAWESILFRYWPSSKQSFSIYPLHSHIWSKKITGLKWQ